MDENEPLDLSIKNSNGNSLHTTKGPSNDVPLDLSTKGKRKSSFHDFRNVQQSKKPRQETLDQYFKTRSDRQYDGQPSTSDRVTGRSPNGHASGHVQPTRRLDVPAAGRQVGQRNVQPPHQLQTNETGDHNVVERPYEINQARDTRTWRRGIEEKTYEVKFDKSKAGEKLINIKDNLTQMFQDVVDLAATNFDKSDKAQLSINHGQLKEEVFIHLQDLRNLTGESIMERIEKVLNSNESVAVDDTLQIHVGLMRLTKGGGPTRTHRSPGPAPPPSGAGAINRSRSGRVLPLFPHLDKTIHSSLFNKKAIVEIVCEENEFVCAAKGIVICMAKLNGMRRNEYTNLIKKSRQSRRGPRSLRTRAENLQRRAGLPLDAPVTVAQLAEFEKILNVKIVVIQFLDGSVKPCITQCSDREDERVIFLYYSQNHFHAVVNSNAMFPKEVICLHCFETYSPLRKDHPCLPSRCYVCKNGQCEKGNVVICPDCNMVCRSQPCFDRHKEVNERSNTTLCETRHKCKKCQKVINLKKQSLADHRCGQYQCHCCKEFVDQDHLCFLRRKGPKSTSGKFLLFDFETMQDSIFECEAGYRPSDRTCSNCSTEEPCNKCKRCTKCKKSNCGRHIHQVNLVVSQTVCDLCKGDPLTQGGRCRSCGDLCLDCQSMARGDAVNFECTDPMCGVREKIFSGYDAIYKFCSFLLTPMHKSFHCLAHNGRGFDFSFVLNYCLTEAQIIPECVYAGSKLMTMYISDGLDIRFIDSLSFMGMALKKLPKAFGLRPEAEMQGCPGDVEELKKGDFPHKMNTRENQNYRGPFPPLEMYGVESMSPDEREKLLEWHAKQEGKIFDLQEEMLAYCRLDVTILRLACSRFRELFMEITTVNDDDGSVLGFVDPFAHITIASACMQVFRVNYIEEYYNITTKDQGQGRATFKSGKWWLNGERVEPDNILSNKFVSSNIAQVPSQGYVRNSNHSKISIAWLEWESKKLGTKIRHARNRGEKVIVCGSKRYLVDGFDEENNVIYEFHGCRYHACPTCYPNQKIRDSRSGFALEDIHKMTVNRTAELRKAGYQVIEIYECQFMKMIQANPALKKFVDELDVPQRMKIRDCFYGGRTSVFTMYHECTNNEEIHYADVCSLYPSINKYSRMPVGHPEIITRELDESLKSYFGIVHCRVLPPKNEYCPVLPVRMGGKLTFPLCKSCAESNHHGDCKHSDKDRMITGSWCTPEVMVALEQGYKIDKIHEVYHYPESAQYNPDTKTGGLFSEQVDTFLKIKAEASGWPDWVSSEDDKQSYLRTFQEKSGVILDREKISKNPALRSIAKICLNSFWGKWGQRSNMSQVKFLTSTLELQKLQNNSQRIMNRFHVVNEDVLAVEYRNMESFEKESFITNEVLAAFTTCWARLELLKHIKSVGERILYCDTDSIIFRTLRMSDQDGNDYFDIYPELGDSLGELTNELPPGVHITRFASTAPKSYSYRCSDSTEVTKFKGVSLNFENSQKVNFQAVKELVFGELESVSLNPQTQFVRSKYDGIICNADLIKTVKCTLNKRRILENFDTVPFGYVFQ